MSDPSQKVNHSLSTHTHTHTFEHQAGVQKDCCGAPGVQAGTVPHRLLPDAGTRLAALDKAKGSPRADRRSPGSRGAAPALQHTGGGERAERCSLSLPRDVVANKRR